MSSCKFCGRELDYGCGQCPDHTAPYNCTGSRPGGCYQREIDALRAEVAALKEAQEKDGAAMRMAVAELSRRRLEVAALKAKLDKANERAEQAGAEWKRAREAWETYCVTPYGNRVMPQAVVILDKFFSVTEQTTNDKEPK